MGRRWRVDSHDKPLVFEASNPGMIRLPGYQLTFLSKVYPARYRGGGNPLHKPATAAAVLEILLARQDNGRVQNC